MDPWLVPISSSVDSKIDINISLKPGSVQDTHKGLEKKFEDNFIPVSDNNNQNHFEKLPDSAVYLASLEKKLQKLQSSVVDKREKSKEILRTLGENRESCMLNFLSGNSIQVSEFEDLKVNPLLKKIQPEKQALSAEELIQLLKADQLQSLQEEEEETKIPVQQSTSEDPNL